MLKALALRTAMVGAAAAAAVTLAAGPALAATGTITIQAGSQWYSLHNPPAGCRSISQQFPPYATVRNGTDATIVLHTDRFCSSSESRTVPPGESTTFAVGSIDVGS